MKNCFCCKRKYPLFMFSVEKRFTIKSDEGKVRCCRICVFKNSKDKVARLNKNGKFHLIKLTLKERIKEFFKK